ncbi:MAG: transcription antitermination factor NusB [Gammaproteobacteria bacterium]|nr:transcription antitermination factor NusB [Gammaproteobacteria bacterium]
MSRGRFFARRAAMQALYQWQVGGESLLDIEQQFYDNPKLPRIDTEYFQAIARGVSRTSGVLTEALAPYCNKPVDELDPVERAVLWIGAYELLERPDIPYRVVINEAVELAKNFGAQESHSFVNGVLDALAKQTRTVEIGAN